MLRFDITGIPSHQAVVGSRGSGKTLMLKFLQRIVPKETGLDVVYVNCRHHNTSFRILAHLLRWQDRGIQPDGAVRALSADLSRKTVVVLDEVDLMSPKDRRREILYLLSRSERPFMVVMLSNNPQVLKELDAATRSSLQPMPLHFRNYNAQQIEEILRGTGPAMVCSSWDEGQLAQIAALTTRGKTNADARWRSRRCTTTVTEPGQPRGRHVSKQRGGELVIDVINDLAGRQHA